MKRLRHSPVLPFTLLLLALPALTGCVTKTRAVQRTLPPPVVQEASLDQLVTGLDQRYTAINTMSATVEIVASTGGGKTGQVKEYPSFTGYIFLRKPADLRVLLLVPVLRSKAIDMVSDGKGFKLVIPPRNKAIVGTNAVTQHSKNGLENLRPAVFLDSLLIRGPGNDKIVSRVLESRVVQPSQPGAAPIEEPDYDLAVLGQPQNRTAATDRVVRISRDNLLPYQQDIYDSSGEVETRASYSRYQQYGSINFPSKIVIERPLDQYSLTLTITKATFNDPLDNDEFELKIPEGMPVQQMK